jgi:hypothetical protein
MINIDLVLLNLVHLGVNWIRKRVANSVDLSDIHALIFGTKQNENGSFIR